MNSTWNNNLAAFKSRFPQLAEIYKDSIVSLGKALETGDIPPFWQVKPSKAGDITATENGLVLHSTYNPVREAAGAVAQAEVEAKGTTVFFGFGLGYHIIEWAKKYGTSDKKLVVIEPDAAHFFASLSLLDWSQVFKVEQLIIALACPAENILGLIEDQSKVNIGNTGVSDAFFFKIPAFTAHAQNYFDTINTIIERNIQKNKINEATLKKFGKLWCRNSVNNIKQLANCSFIFSLKNKTEFPFLIIGAGPSLQKIIPVLNELKKRMIVVCVETALHTLLENHIEPDFIILLDPQYWAYKHISGLSSPSSVLITEVSAYPSVFRFNCQQILLCGSQFPIGQYFEKKLNIQPGDLGTGGSVASSAWNFAKYCGAKEIYVAGLDLSFPGKQTHIKGSSAEQTFHKLSYKIKTAEKYGISSLFSANAQPGVNYLNQPVLTDSRMKMFAWWFESRIAACPEVKTYTLCPESLKIPGIEIAAINDILNKPEITKADFFANIKQSTVNKTILAALQKNFPTEEFLNESPFLKPYL